MPRTARPFAMPRRFAARPARLRFVALLIGALALAPALTIAPAAAQQSGNADSRLEVTVTAQGEAQRRNLVTVDVDGLAAFADGTLAVYQCGNADSSGRPIEPAAGDCFAPGEDGYVTTPIGDQTSATVRYQIARRGVGANGARCIPALDGAAPCQLVVGAVNGSDAEIVGVVLDDALADFDEAATADRPEGNGTDDAEPAVSLPVTGLGPRGVAIAFFVAAGCLYVGSLLRSTARAA